MEASFCCLTTVLISSGNSFRKLSLMNCRISSMFDSVVLALRVVLVVPPAIMVKIIDMVIGSYGTNVPGNNQTDYHERSSGLRPAWPQTRDPRQT